MKKKIIVVVFMVLAVAVYGQQFLFGDYVSPSEGGLYYCEMFYQGKKRAQELNNILRLNKDYKEAAKIDNTRLEIVNKLLSRYQHTIGDTYEIHMGVRAIGSDMILFTQYIFVEFTSNTQYNLWYFLPKEFFN